MENHPQWMVLYHNRNAKKIEPHNVLHHGGIREDIVKATKKCKTKEEFAKELRSNLLYYYWSKCEWEVLISPWISHHNDRDIKVDVYWQVMNNWDKFLDYVWENRKKL